MKRRERWRAVLDAELGRWSHKSYDQLRTELAEMQDYAVQFAAKLYQVEVQLVENTDDYVHVAIGVDDGSLRWSIWPVGADFIRKRSA
jgi:hypothetical protein